MPAAGHHVPMGRRGARLVGLIVLAFAAGCTSESSGRQAVDPAPAPEAGSNGPNGKPCPGQRPPQPPRPMRPLTDIVMVSDERGFAVGDGVIAATTDGRHWVEQYVGPGEFVQVEAVDADHAWAVGRNELFGTVDGGRHWSPLAQPDGAVLRTVHFVSTNSGWGAGQGRLFRTSNGGRTWEPLETPCGAEAVCFTDRQHGWVATGGRVDRSTDAGRSWSTSFQLPASNLYVKELQCTPAGVVWASFTAAETSPNGYRSYVVFRGSPAGEWQAVAEEPVSGPHDVDAPPAGSHPPRLSALGPEEAVLLTYTPPRNPPVGLLLATAGGRSLGAAERPVTGLARRAAASFRSAELGWVVGESHGDPDRGVILSTRDGGRSWQQQYSHAQ
jgi:photosystem II stability/assembly factor-like uncharacterized protein